MAVKTFTQAEQLTAADTNTYLTNGGLVYVNSWTVGSGVASVSMTNAFPSDYNAFRLIWVGGTMTSSSNNSQLALQVGNGGTWLTSAGSYYQTLLYIIRTSNTTPRATGLEGTQQHFAYVGGGFTDGAALDVTLLNVNRAQKTHIQSQMYTDWGDSAQGSTAGFINNSVAYFDAKILVTGTGTMSNGKIYSYGYRTA